MNFNIFVDCLLLPLIMNAPVQDHCRGDIRAKNIPTEVKYALLDIKIKTTVPIIIPTILPRDDIPLIAGGRVEKKYAKDAYDIFYGTSYACNSNKCSFGSTGGELISDITENPIETYNLGISLYVRSGRPPEHPKKTEELGGYITLSRGISGFYIPFFCYTYCNDAKIVWQQGEYQYYVAKSKGGTLKELVKIANSAIENEP